MGRGAAVTALNPTCPASASVSTFYVNSSVCERDPCWDPGRRERALNGAGVVAVGGVAFTDLCALSRRRCASLWFCIAAEESGGAANAAFGCERVTMS